MHKIDHAAIDPQIREFREAEPNISAPEIARRLRAKHIKISEDAVRTSLRRMGFAVGNNARLPAQNTEIAALHRAGHTDGDIASAVGLSKSVVRKRIADMELGRRNIRRSPKPKPPPKPQLEHPTLLTGYPRRNQEIPSYVRTLPVLPSISGPEFGNEHYYYNQEFNPLAIAGGGDESGGLGGGDSPSAA